MRRLLVVLMMLCPVAAMGQTSAAGQANAVASEYPLTVHVISSRARLAPEHWHRNFFLLLRVKIEGRKYVLATLDPEGLFTGNSPVLIEPGDYPGRVIKDKTPNPGEIRRTYELRLPNGEKVKAFAWGMSE